VSNRDMNSPARTSSTGDHHVQVDRCMGTTPAWQRMNQIGIGFVPSDRATTGGVSSPKVIY
jgi:hypothetical protein